MAAQMHIVYIDRMHERSLQHLSRNKHFGPLIKKHGPPDFTRYHGRSRVFTALLRSIVSQQISTKAAAAVRERFLKLFPKNGPTPNSILEMPAQKLRAVGLSKRKIEYMRDAARKFKDRTVNPRKFRTMTSQEIINHLVQIKGVGVWTTHMLLIFTLKRPDILPTGDLGIRRGFQRLYGLKKEPTHARMEQLAKEWREHASVASWYLWRMIDTEPQ